MADSPISGLPASAALDGTEEVAIAQAGVTVKTTTEDIKNFSSFEATKVTISEDTDGGTYNITLGNYESIGLSLVINITDSATQDIKVETQLPSVLGSFGQAAIDIGLFAGAVEVETIPLVISNDERVLTPSFWFLRPLSFGPGNVTLELKIKNTSGEVVIDNSVGSGGYLNVQQYKDVA